MPYRSAALLSACLPGVLALCLSLSPPALAQGQPLLDQAGKPLVLGAKRGPRRKAGLCLDYGKTRFRDGAPYRVIEPDRTITSHEGMDFCKRAGSPVIAPLDGRVRFVEQDNAVYGGVVAITSGASVRPRPGLAPQQIFVEMVHIVPLQGLRPGQAVTAGQVVGHVQRANRPSIGKSPHVHFALRRCNDWATCHLDPNFFWRDGPGRLSCHDGSKPLPPGRIVAPVPC
ncbi:M23 family metallopeptidase [Mameliella sp. LZ-28]|uniref:M23 family metallopeptidase n=1 Tax=Mameliella sp. LZ-28 TaxID=2484146 RepID=UPI00143F5908|nr:M23 family metallopeptidase [Mameliella sp. LZ-28]